MKKVKDKFKNLGIKSKLILIFAPIIISFILLEMLVNYYHYSKGIESKTIQNIKDTSSIIEYRVQSIFEYSGTCLNLIVRDVNTIYDQNRSENLTEADYVEMKNKIHLSLDYNRRSFDGIHSAVFIDQKGRIITNGISGEMDSRNIENNLIAKIPVTGSPKSEFLSVDKRTYFNIEEPILTIGKRVIDFETGKTIGYLFLNILESYIRQVFPEGNNTYSTFGEYYILDSQNRIIVSNDESSLLHTFKDITPVKLYHDGKNEFKNNRSLYIFNDIPVTGWLLVNQTSLDVMNKEVNSGTKILIILGVFFVWISVILTFIFSRKLTKPLTELEIAMLKVRSGDLDISLPVNSEDEIGVLANTFNEMILQIKELLSQIKIEQKKITEYELSLIHAQIKPHFLYNTLDLIYVLSSMNNSKQAADITKALADFYRTSLSSGVEIVTLKEELINIESYTKIQKIRYSDTLSIHIMIDPELLDNPVPKLTLQPIVENAIYHGLREKDGRGNIRIYSEREGQFIRIIVEDDGSGIKIAKLKELEKAMENEGKRFGLRSVNRRLRIYFGKLYGLKIESKSCEGTKVIIQLPKKNGEGK